MKCWEIRNGHSGTKGPEMVPPFLRAVSLNSDYRLYPQPRCLHRIHLLEMKNVPTCSNSFNSAPPQIHQKKARWNLKWARENGPLLFEHHSLVPGGWCPGFGAPDAGQYRRNCEPSAFDHNHFTPRNLSAAQHIDRGRNSSNDSDN